MAKVDVLADLKQARAALSQNATYPADVALARNAIDRALSAAESVIAERDALLKARAAIAELIAADKEYDEANENFANAKAGSVAQRMSRFSAAERRRASALAALESQQ